MPSKFECELFPFQKRAVAWMLGREGVILDNDGRLMDNNCRKVDLPSRFPVESCAYEVPTSSSDVLGTASMTHTALLHDNYKSMKGGILAEEMGLGKTVEVLALICVHPRAASPRKSNLEDSSVLYKIGSAEAALDVKMVKNSPRIYGISNARPHESPHRLYNVEYTQYDQFYKTPDQFQVRIPSEATPNVSLELEQCSATLIITPPAILDQWEREIRTHIPMFKVFVYQGMSKMQQLFERGVDTTAEKAGHSSDKIRSVLCSHDIVLTTYNVLSKEIHHAREIPDRATRSGNIYKRQRSPLVTLDWWRVVLDEAQMIESGVSNAAKVARLIPRQNAWAVSGTPVRKDAEDLRGLLIFLRIEPYAGSQRLWNRMVTCYPQVFQRIFNTLALRHTKETIRQEITLPPQKRMVVNMAFSQIEEQNYSQMLQELCDQLGVNRHGQPLSDHRSDNPAPAESIMRGWLTRLRQVCLHPEVGDRNHTNLGRSKAPRTVDQVLDVMMEQNETALLAEERNLLMSRIRRGQILEHAGNSQSALDIWERSLGDSQRLVHECRRQLSLLLGERHKFSEDGRPNDNPRSRESEEAERTLEGLDSKENEPLNMTVYRQRLRSMIDLEHLCTFFVANAYYQIRLRSSPPAASPVSDLGKKETEAYDRAKMLRKELLVESERKAERRMGMIRSSTTKATHIPAMKELSLRTTVSKAESICTRLDKLVHALNCQADLIKEMQDELRRLLYLPLVDQEDPQEVQGDEYETSTKQQDDLYVRVDVFRAVVSDRHEAVSGQKNNRIDNEMAKLLKDAEASSGHSPELLLKLAASRQHHKPSPELGSIKGLLSEMRELKTFLKTHVREGSTQGDSEATGVVSLYEIVQEMSRSQWKLSVALEKQSEIFTDTMNARLEYYRQLQRISDTVTPWEVDYTDTEREDILSDMQDRESKIIAQATTLKSKARYLMHLKEDASVKSSASTRLCVVCQCGFDRGLLTSCGHTYCGGCWQMWWKSHRTCPACKKKLWAYDLHQIAEKPQNLVAEEETLPRSRTSSRVSTPRPNGIYASVRTSVLDEIKNIEISQSYGTKVDTLTRHILWLRDKDPGAKSVIFSQYRDFLKLLKTVFVKAKIGCATIEEKDGITNFKTDASVECFFLHAQAQSSGLNLVEATHVFLCEPLLNYTIEIQAIARVDRIGQHSPTTVWMYIINGTVEKAIYELSIRRRLTHMGKVRSENGLRDGPGSHTDEQSLSDEFLEAANTRELQETATANLFSKGRDSAGDEVVAQSDLWKCLFSQHSREGGVEGEEALNRNAIAEIGDGSIG